MIRFLKTFWWVVFLPGLAYLFALLVQDDPGLVFLSGTLPSFGFGTARPFSIIMTFTGLLVYSVVIFLGGYLIIRFCIHFLNIPKYFGRFRQKRKELASERRFARAQLALIENNPRLAEDLFVAATNHSANASLCLVGAAKAAQMQGDTNRRDKYLQSISNTHDTENTILAGIYRSELLMDAQEFKKAQTVLENMQSEHPNHHRILTLLAKTYQKQGLFDALYQIMPTLHSALPKAHRLEVEADLYIDLIDNIAQKNDAALIKDIWNHIPRELKTNPGVVINYAEKLLYCGAVDEAEAALFQSLKKNWNDLVITAYGHLFRGNLPLQIKHAKALYKSHPDSAYAAIAIARLLIKNKEYSDALTLLHEALAIDPSVPDIHHLLAELMVEKGDFETAVRSFREASRLTYAKPSAELLQVEGEYMAHSDLTKIDHTSQTPRKTEDEVIIDAPSEEDSKSTTH